MLTPERSLSKEEKTKTFIDELKLNNPEIFSFISNNYIPDSPLNVNKENKIETDEGEYFNTLRIQELVRVAQAIKEKLPTIPAGCVRLWRGNRQDEVGKNPSYTNSLSGIALPFLISYGGVLSYVDVPLEISKIFLKDGCVAEDSEFIVSSDILSKVKIVGLDEKEKDILINKSKGLEENNEGEGWRTIII